MSQVSKIRQKLLAGETITALDAFYFGCLRLAARINDLRNQGMNIKTTKVTRGNKTFAEYKLIQ